MIKIRLRVILIIMGIVAVVIVAAMVASGLFTRWNVESVRADLQTINSIVDDLISTDIQRVKEEADARAKELEGVSDSQLQSTLEQITIFYDVFNGMAVFNDSGSLLALTGKAPTIGMDFENSYIQEALAGNLQISTTTVSPITAETVFFVLVPMRDGRVFAGTLPNDHFSSFVQNIRIWDSGNVFIMDQDGYSIANYRSNVVSERFNHLETGRSNPDFDSVEKINEEMVASRNSGSGLYTLFGSERVAVWQRISAYDDWILATEAFLDESPTINIQMVIRAAASIILILGILVSIITSDIVARNVKKATQREKLLDTVNKATTILLVTEEKERFDELLLKAMELMGKCVDMDRVQIWQNEMVDGELSFVHKVQWLSEFGKTQKSDEVGFHIPYSAAPDWEQRFLRGEAMNGPISEMSGEDRAVSGDLEVKSTVIIPLFIKEEFWGFFSLDECRKERSLSADEMKILRVGGLLIANAVLNNDMVYSLRVANDSKSDFLAKMSHEMRTPLNAVIGLSELSIDSGNVDEETQSNLEKIYNAGNMLLSTVNDILDISKIEAGRLELVPMVYDVSSMINDVVTQNILRIGEKPIRFALDIDRNLPARFIGDELRVKQMMNNLLSNAIKYTEEGSTTLGVSCVQKGNIMWMTIAVTDTGVGIRPEDLSQLFLDYTRLDLLTNRKVGGTGLGLALTKRMAEMMGGFVTVESEYGKGSTFTVKIKQEFVDEAIIGSKVAEDLQKFHFADNKRKQRRRLVRVKLPDAKVLIVDDVMANLDVAKGLMKPYGMQVDCITSGQEAINAIQNETVTYNAIFMDHMMPGMDGIEAMAKIRELGTDYAKNIPIIALTANAVAGSKEKFLSAGFQDFLSKPMDVPRLDAVIRRWVAKEEN